MIYISSDNLKIEIKPKENVQTRRWLANRWSKILTSYIVFCIWCSNFLIFYMFLGSRRGKKKYQQSALPPGRPWFPTQKIRRPKTFSLTIPPKHFAPARSKNYDIRKKRDIRDIRGCLATWKMIISGISRKSGYLEIRKKTMISGKARSPAHLNALIRHHIHAHVWRHINAHM